MSDDGNMTMPTLSTRNAFAFGRHPFCFIKDYTKSGDAKISSDGISYLHKASSYTVFMVVVSKLSG